jgi:hypothetical protein
MLIEGGAADHRDGAKLVNRDEPMFGKQHALALFAPLCAFYPCIGPICHAGAPNGCSSNPPNVKVHFLNLGD